MLLTVFTPTYNRAGVISRTFESLCRQTDRDFEWLVVDDGSTDHTRAMIEEYKSKADFPIVYIYITNGGKHTAYNTALDHARGQLFFTVDSDDWLPDDSVARIHAMSARLLSDPAAAGIMALKQLPDGNLIGLPYPAGLDRSTLIALERGGNGGERSIVFKTDVARRYPFPVIPGERFMTESVVYDKIGADFEFLISNEVLTTCEYQSDGLSSAPYRTIVSNPGGYALYFAGRIDLPYGIRGFIHNVIRFLAVRTLYGHNVYNGKYRMLLSILRPLGVIGAHFYKSKAK